jgi:MFS family permease
MAAETIETQIPARLDRLPWTRWHWVVVWALGLVWVLDGLEVTIVGSIAARLTEDSTLGLSNTQIGAAGAIYIAGAVTGALVFGYLTDRMGRKRLFIVTLALYLVATVLTAFSWNFLAFAIFRFFTGMGIGGEYSAVNSAIDELIPARVRGWVDLAINGSWWVGTAVGAALSIVLLNTDIFAADVGWRLGFGLGAILGVAIIAVRWTIPESPRWLMVHGRAEEAERIVGGIEERVEREAGTKLEEPGDAIAVHQRERTGFVEIARVLFRDHRRRSVLGFMLMSAQAFAYNAVFFTYGLVLATFYGVSDSSVPYYILPFALGNFVGPLVLGRLFDVVGRRPMIALSYGVAGILLAVTGVLFQQDVLSATWQTVLWSVIFFFASAGASSAYLTVSEVFPLEVRAMAIAFFFAVSTAIGGITGPLLFGALVESESRTATMWGYLLGAAWLVAAAVTELVLGVRAEQESLEDVATPLSAEEAEGGEGGEERPRHRPRRRRAHISPQPLSSHLSHDDPQLDGEVGAILGALEDGPATRRELARRVSARLWGPGRFRTALAVARAEGLVRRAGRDRVALADRG